VRVPKHQHKLIIGAGGKTIREIIKETGAKIKIPPGDDDDEEVVIEGSPEAVYQAAERVTKATMFQERVRDTLIPSLWCAVLTWEWVCACACAWDTGQRWRWRRKRPRPSEA
jgi:hypothetical protein